MYSILKKLQYRTKYLWQDFLFKIGYTYNLNPSPGAIRTVCFHGICRDDHEYINARFYKIEKLKQLFLEINVHFNIISLQDFIDRNISNEKTNVLITFDDGYKNNKDLLLPIIEELEIPITIFITARSGSAFWMDLLDLAFHKKTDLSFITKKYPILKNKSNQFIKKWGIQQQPEIISQFTKLLSEQVEEDSIFSTLLSTPDLIEMNKNPLISFANHSANHYSFNTLKPSEQTKELNQVAERLRIIKSTYYMVLGYPFGEYTEATADFLYKKGYHYQFTTDVLPKKNTKTYGRIIINPFLSINNQVKVIADGKY